MTDVDLNTKELKRIMGWYSMLAKKSKQIDADEKLFKKISVMYDAEKDFEDSILEE